MVLPYPQGPHPCPPQASQPPAQGLYDPAHEHDACGVSFVADLNGRRSHDVVAKGLAALCRLDHRGARGAEQNTGDGAGIMIQVPDEFLRAVVDFDLPPAGQYATGLVFLPAEPADEARVRRIVEKYALVEGADVLGWRDVPVQPDGLGETADAARPRIAQLFLSAQRLTDSAAGPAGTPLAGLDLDRVAFCVRKQAERESAERGVTAYFPSLSGRTMVYKGMLTPDQLPEFYPDLRDERVASAIALVHSRFSTNTFPSWPLSHPYRFIAHNGEINTIRGNKNWMNAREALLATGDIPGNIRRLFPVCTPQASDSANFDEVLELLHLAGRSLPHAVLMMIPEAWENDPGMEPAKRDFYRFHASLMEPWDGPASVAFTDGELVGAVLDRNGLRPGRWWRTSDGLVVLGSEAGVLDLDPATVIAKGRLRPGRMFLVDTAAGRIVEDEEIKAELAAAHPYGDWLHAGLIDLRDLPERDHIVYAHDSVQRRQQTFGYTEEELKILIAPMARKGIEPIGSMGTDTPISPLSTRPRLLFDYFHQLFAQVTNPPLDAIREEMVTSLQSTIGPEANLLDPGPASCRQIVLPYPIIDNDELAKILSIDEDGDLPGFKAVRVSGLYPLRDGADGIKARLTEICRHVSEAIEDGVRIFVLSDRDSTVDLAPIPSLLLTAAVHQHLVREQTRTQVALLVESGDCREVHHAAVLIGYGAAAVNPYLAFESVEDLIATGALAGITSTEAIGNYVKALGKGVLKIMSKMGISTVSSYCGAQVFEAVGLDPRLVERYFAGTPGTVGGVGLSGIHAEIAARHDRAYPSNSAERSHRRLDVGGEYQWRREGELHLFNPETVFLLQHATRSGQYDVFRRYTATVDGLAAEAGSLRGLFTLRDGVREPVPIDEVEPASEIVKRFSTGAMSYGSISAESHETLAIAMNRLGGRSNTGEGGEDVDRLYDPARRSAVKQIASGRFGVTSEYLVNADDLQIKMAQGAKPGEGGQLPGNKVWPWIAKTRHATPGVGLISPPPHHDIYSIEDLAQLVHDLKCVNPAARVHVKLVSEIGVGTVAAGVAKLKADVILISGHDGGTGASPLNSLKHAGTPWELGLAETQQTLLLNKLRDRVTVQVDGQLKTGRDVLIAALLGAEEYGFATAPLIVSGCVMMRVCHLDTCPVGIATQNPVLRERFTGKPEFVENFFLFLAEEVRSYLAELGFRSIDEAIGRADLLDTTPAVEHWKARGLDLSAVLHVPALPAGAALRGVRAQDHGLDRALDNELITLAGPALTERTPVRASVPVRNEHRSVGAMLGGEVTRRVGGAGLPDDTIEFTLTGTAGQSFGAFLPRGVTLRLVGDANDYVGKGLSGGRLIVRPDPAAPFAAPGGAGAEEQIIAGNTILYGATAGELFLRGRVGERFAVRNSGAVTVVEGVGDHGCEYMTGGTVVVLGPTGRNFAAGMSGGTAYLWRLDENLVNRELVDLEPVAADAEPMLRELVERHFAETDSAVAEALLKRWPEAVEEFTVVVPRDYRRVLETMRAAEAAGRDVDEAVMEVARA
ncbi:MULTISPECIES: glutamate synthase large subunit [unclassified Solwaraspora]|uniref:glutamate synthase large subunit n=1 Tax=unclassified Solwaraspora TaxID=2627926 RepID=UPI00248CF660|nr:MULTISPECIES: glutamate synthase large subunit [unclassified Solwaraspora]WBB94926.1 glutamate synthase large subunit [Solwaraspora sp. WMMA2059]WBC21191.1 glutamate synthase large subunit [Solwaraspora sp. WMMA2080]WJK36727.1 glutamate synthase large subunit [Solwaraspora sp. WMMA2065]